MEPVAVVRGGGYLLILNLLSVVMRAAVGVFAMVVALMRVGFRGAEAVAEGKGGDKEEEEEEGEKEATEKRFHAG